MEARSAAVLGLALDPEDGTGPVLGNSGVDHCCGVGGHAAILRCLVNIITNVIFIPST
jgi:hypothetical protein